jgi:hypothetical protein
MPCPLARRVPKSLFDLSLVGILASLALAFGGLLLGAWGFSRRDLRG